MNTMMMIKFLHGALVSCCLLFSYVVGIVIYNLFFHPLRLYPGPRSWAATSFPRYRSSVSGYFVRDILNLHLKYGEAVRIAPDEISYSTASAWKDVYAHRVGHQEFAKHPLSQPVPVNGVLGIIGANRENHARYRRLLSHAFSERGLREQEPLIKWYTSLLIQRLGERVGKGSQNMVEFFNWTTFDIIGDLSLGESFSCLETTSTHPWIAFLLGNIKAIPFISVFRRYHVFALVTFFLPRKLLDARQANYQYAKDKLGKRIKLGKDRGDFLDQLLKFEYPKGMTTDEIVSTGLNLVLAGSETTATLLSGATYYLLLNPAVLECLTREIRDAFQSGKDMNIANTLKLEYLNAVLEESLRIYPPVPTGLQRIVPATGDTVMGKWLPGGTTVTVQHLATNHSPANFHEPEKFMPERFLRDCPPEFKNDNYAALQPFAMGPRGCLGKNLAYFEMRLILSRLLFAFDLELDKERTGDWIDQKTYMLWEKHPLWVRLKLAR